MMTRFSNTTTKSSISVAGIRGWLAILIVGVWATELICAFIAVLLVVAFATGNGRVPIGFGIITIFVLPIIAIIGAMALYEIHQRRFSAIKRMIIFIGLLAALFIAAQAAEGSQGGYSLRTTTILVCVAIAWIIYLLRSKRVRNTFIG